MAQELAAEASTGVKGLFIRQTLVKRACPKKDIYKRETFSTAGGPTIVTASVVSNNLIEHVFKDFLNGSATFPLLPVDVYGWALAGTSVSASFITLKPTQTIRLYTSGQCWVALLTHTTCWSCSWKVVPFTCVSGTIVCAESAETSQTSPGAELNPEQTIHSPCISS